MSTPLQDMRQLLKDDNRYKVEAYQFIREALHYASEKVPTSPGMVSSGVAGTEKGASDDDDDSDERGVRSRHITGGQLCHACREYAVDQYGLLAEMVLATWGIRSTSDLGELVYNLIRIGQMRKSENDRREDFNHVFDFAGAFEPKFELAPASDD